MSVSDIAMDSPVISIVVPAYNESLRLVRTVEQIIDYLHQSNRSYELIIVDDGSSDDTLQVAKKLAGVYPGVVVIGLEQNLGKGGAVKRGMLEAKGDLLLFCDADGATPITELERLEQAIVGGADVAIGSRALRSDEVKVEARLHRKLMGRVFNAVANLLLVPGICDTQCGFKLFKKEAAKILFTRQQENGFIFDVEILYLARKLSLQVIEIPINWTDQPGSRVSLLTDPLKMLLALIRLKAIAVVS